MNCNDVCRLVDASVDTELDVAHEGEIQAHLEGCEACSRVYAARRDVRAALARHDLYVRAPLALRQRVRQMVDASHLEGRGVVTAGSAPILSRSWLRWPTTLAAAAVLLLAATGAWMLLTRPAEGDALAQEAVAAHIRSLLPGHLTDVPSSDQHTVKPWFAGRVDFSPPVTDFAAQGFALVGGRLDYVGGRTVAAVVYQRRRHTINLFMWPSRDHESMRIDASRGYNIIRWSGGGLAFCVVSDLNGTELRQLVGMLSGGGAAR